MRDPENSSATIVLDQKALYAHIVYGPIVYRSNHPTNLLKVGRYVVLVDLQGYGSRGANGIGRAAQTYPRADRLEHTASWLGEIEPTQTLVVLTGCAMCVRGGGGVKVHGPRRLDRGGVTSDLTYGHFRPDMPNVRSKSKNGVSNYRLAYQIIVALQCVLVSVIGTPDGGEHLPVRPGTCRWCAFVVEPPSCILRRLIEQACGCCTVRDGILITMTL